MIEHFCNKVIEFLKSEYQDSYVFRIEQRVITPPAILPNNEKIELTVLINPMYKIKITNDSMQYIFNLYCNSEFIEERGQYRWQKELIDMIEGS